MSNAFAGSDWEELDATVSLAAAEHDRELRKQRYRKALIELGGQEGSFFRSSTVRWTHGRPFYSAGLPGNVRSGSFEMELHAPPY
eukprot:2016070-Pyramimonas_sp.AAC.1